MQDSIKLSVKVHAGTRRVGFAGFLSDGTVLIDLKAPPVDGKANRELTAFISRSFKTGKNCIRIISGAGSRRKRLRVNNPGIIPDWYLNRSENDESAVR